MDSCTGLQESEQELKEYLREHPEKDENIFDILDDNGLPTKGLNGKI